MVGELTPNRLSLCGFPALPHWFHTFLKDCGGGESLRMTTCLESILVGMQGHVPCR